MPRPLPPLADDFSREIDQAIDLTRRIEAAQVALRGAGPAGGEIGITGLELAYELAYLRIFLAWESLLEGSFHRFLCGYTRSGVQEVRAGGAAYARTVAQAETLVLGTRQYILWHNPARVIQRADRFFVASNYRLVIASAQARLEQFAAVRHRVAHSQEHARVACDLATVGLAGKRYKGSRPGRFLRDTVPLSSPPERWLVSISDELLSLAQQICT